MGRLGIGPDDIGLFLEKTKSYKRMKLKGVFSHLSSADEADLNIVGSSGALGAEPKPWWAIFGFACCAGDRSGDIDEEDAKQTKSHTMTPMKTPAKK